MATVQDTFSTTLSRTVFRKPPDAIREFTSIPRSLVNFTLNDGALSAKPLNDVHELIIEFILNPTFAYRLVDFNIHLEQDVANDWNAVGVIQTQNAVRNLPPGQTQRHIVDLVDGFLAAENSEMWVGILDDDAAPHYILQPLKNQIVTFRFLATNQTAAAGAAGVVSCFLSFFEYEIEQAEQFELHWPGLALQR